MALDEPETAKQTSPERSIFLTALERRSADERAAYLEQACAGDLALRGEVEALLAAHDRLPAGAPPAATFTAAGTVIGRYKLLEPIGEGGYGTVFMAEQTTPVQRRVALKIIKPGMDTRQVIARFEAERQALALMDHPNIAKVFDAGVTDTERPYFVMELVKGLPITKYCDEHKLPPRARLELFVHVCQAVQHAHQKGIIHRDLKPTNVLVAQYDGKPVPKVIDFGVAKATGQRLTDMTMFTGFGDVIGTPQYMSPEQAELNQLDVDTRSDIYSLGVLLYELLTGTTPLESKRVKEVALLEVLRVIREEEPPRPSTRLTTTAELPSIAAQRGLEPKSLSGIVRGELDWIVMKALEKDRARRYETANGLAMDVQRYLADDTVHACPPSSAYRLRKFARKHRGPVVAAGLVLLTLIGGIVGTTYGLVRAEQARRAETARAQGERNAREESQAREAETQAVVEFLQRKFLDARKPVQNGGLGPDITLGEVAEKALPLNDRSFGDKPLLEARLRLMLSPFGSTSPDSVEQVARALDLYTKHRGPDHPETLRSMTYLSQNLFVHGQLDEAIKVREEMVARTKAKLGPDHADTLMPMENLTALYEDTGRFAQAVTLGEEMVTRSKAALGHDHPETMQRMARVAYANAELGRHAEALAIREQILALRKARHGPGHYETLYAMQRLAESYAALGRKDEATKLHEQVLARWLAKLGPGGTTHIGSLDFLAKCYAALGRHAESAKVREQLLAISKPSHGEDFWLSNLPNTADSYLRAGRHADAFKLLDEARAFVRPDHPYWNQSRLDWLLKVVATGLATNADPARRDPARAVALAEELVARAPKEPAHWDVLGIARYRAGDFRGAVAALEKDPERVKERGGFFLAMTHWRLGHKDEALRSYQRAVEWNKTRATDDDVIRFRSEAAELLGADRPK
jgi:eukaryotic-like serine/threonine-protein kinase